MKISETTKARFESRENFRVFSHSGLFGLLEGECNTLLDHLAKVLLLQHCYYLSAIDALHDIITAENEGARFTLMNDYMLSYDMVLTVSNLFKLYSEFTDKEA